MRVIIQSSWLGPCCWAAELFSECCLLWLEDGRDWFAVFAFCPPNRPSVPSWCLCTCQWGVGGSLSDLKLLQTQSHRSECVCPLPPSQRWRKVEVKRFPEEAVWKLDVWPVLCQSCQEGDWSQTVSLFLVICLHRNVHFLVLFLGFSCSCKPHRHFLEKSAARNLRFIFIQDRTRGEECHPPGAQHWRTASAVCPLLLLMFHMPLVVTRLSVSSLLFTWIKENCLL